MLQPDSSGCGTCSNFQRFYSMSDFNNGNGIFPDPEKVKEEMLAIYPPKTRRKRDKQIVLNDPETPREIGANTRTVPGIITQRGCTYAGCKGVVVGPIGDMLHITHGPIGCGYYSWLSRRNLTRAKDSSHGKEDRPVNYLHTP